jgi:hypothetical protein
MTNEDFQGLFSADEQAELALAAEQAELEAQKEALEAEVAAAAKPKQDGLWFSHNEDDSNGHAISVYVVRMGGKEVLYARVNTALTVEVPGLPAGVSAHPIVVAGTTGKQIETKGFGLMAPHNDGTGTHIDGQTVRSFIVPRLPRFLGELYGV